MSGKDLLIDPSLLDFDNVIADVEEIRRYNPQRFEMEQLSAVVYEDLEQFAKEAAAKGYPLSDGPTTSSTGTVFAFIDAPEGYEIELIQAPK